MIMVILIVTMVLVLLVGCNDDYADGGRDEDGADSDNEDDDDDGYGSDEEYDGDGGGDDGNDYDGVASDDSCLYKHQHAN